jgi:hypothetical protein
MEDKKMSFLEKLGLIEREEVETPVTVPVAESPEVDANVEINSTENVIDEIYAQNGMSNKDNSIYAVQSFIDTLPSEMTTVKKQSSVYGILKVTGKSVESLLEDAESRIDILSLAKVKVFEEKDTVINAAKNDIEELKRAIEAANIVINDAEAIKESTAKAVSDEVDAIAELIKFCEGMGEK